MPVSNVLLVLYSVLMVIRLLMVAISVLFCGVLILEQHEALGVENGFGISLRKLLLLLFIEYAQCAAHRNRQ